MSPNYLLKDELEYELCVRGVPCFGDVISLRKRLPTAISDSLSSSPEKYLTVDVQDEFRICTRKLAGLEQYRLESDLAFSLVAARIKTRFQHPLARFHHLLVIDSSAL
jgi:hypothetical protein